MKRTEQILEAIDKLTKEKGFPPTVREIGDRVGLKSSSTTKGHLDRLRAKGLVDWEEGKPRTLHILRKEEATI
ncbi:MULTISPECIES: LexA family protein [Bacillus]|uniref:LexA family protein n=1 Tax=Bacillus TaxID=1386 RepID=UPI00263A7455|nr:transcriptional regulator [Bacillus glycinifermentans]WKB77986.1 transcriptional regulator [Bacillus glycinifermentans]